jgi:hypothetical protein
MMDGIESWSAFEQQQRQRKSSLSRSDASIDAAPDNVVPGIDALYVSSSSLDIAPAAATLLRHSGLAAVNKSKDADIVGGSKENSQITSTDEEFRLRFHWIRPHPSLAFSLEEVLSTTGAEAGIADGNKVQEGGEDHARGQYQISTKIHPAIESASLMEAYRSSQIKKTPVDIPSRDEDDDRDAPKNHGSDKSSKDADRDPSRIQLEFPMLRINLASLIEPPLMTSWLPGEDYGISCDSEDEGDVSE